MEKNSKTNIKVNVNVNGLFGILLTILFIALKLCGVINWAWIWVLCPLWIGLVLVLIIVLIGTIAAILINK